MTDPSGFETHETDEVGEPWSLPQGALPRSDEAVLWRTWAPRAARDRFVACVDNHDQIGNRAVGDRLAANLSDAAYRLALGQWALHPAVPLLFMGSEYGERRPFPFFCSFEDPGLVESVRRGQRAEFAEKGFAWEEIPDPQDPATFESARLGWTWPEGSRAAGIRTLVADLLRERRTRAGLRDRARTDARVVEVERSGDETPAQVLVVERGLEGAVVAWANPHDGPVALPVRERARDVPFLSTCDVRYGGTREPGAPLEELRPFERALFADEERR